MEPLVFARVQSTPPSPVPGTVTAPSTLGERPSLAALFTAEESGLLR